MFKSRKASLKSSCFKLKTLATDRPTDRWEKLWGLLHSSCFVTLSNWSWMQLLGWTNGSKNDVFLAVQNSSIGLIVGPLVGLTPLIIRAFTTLQSDPRDLWPLRHLIRQIFRKFSDFWKILIFGKCSDFQVFWRIFWFLKKFQIFERFSYFWRIFGKIEIFRKFSYFWKIFIFLEDFRIFGRFSDFWKIFRFLEDFQIFERFSYFWKIIDFWRIFRFLEDFHIFGIFSDFWTILGLVTFETLITILTIENLNSWQSLLSDN